MFPNAGSYEEVPTIRIRWDNPVPMMCGHFIRRAAGGSLGSHAHYCGSDAFYVFVRGEDAVGFRCFIHKDDIPAMSDKQGRFA